MKKTGILILLIACGAKDSDTAETGDPPECRNDGSFTEGLRFQESTEGSPLAFTSDQRGLRMSTADLNQDGFPDLVLSEIGTHKHNDYGPEGKIQRRLLLNRDGKSWEDVSEASGLFRNSQGEPGHAAAIHIFGDVDNDGDLDVFSGVYTDQSRDDDPGDRSMIHLNDGTGVFTAAESSEISIEKGYATVGASFLDYDADGFLDLWVVGFYKEYGASYAAEQDQLFKGLGDGRFEEVTNKMGLKMKASGDVARWIDGTGRRPAYGATACEINGDGKIDLIATNYARTWNQIWAQVENGFEDIGMTSGFSSDENQDYSDNEFYRCYCQSHTCDPMPSAPVVSCGNYWNAGFDDTPARLNGNSFSTACGDVDADGDMDLLTAEIVHWHIGQSSDPTELLLNDGTGNFTRPGNAVMGLERSWPSNSWNEGDINAAFFDFDNDSYQDILIGSSDYPDTHIFLYRQKEDGTFTDVSAETGMNQPWPAGLAIADFDADGDLDVVTGSSTARSGTPWEDRRLHFYENLSSGNAARIRLEGSNSNGAGIGAEVRVSTENRTQLFAPSGGYGHFGLHNTTTVHAGLGEACRFDAEVIWPGGKTDQWHGLSANVDWTLIEGGQKQRKN